MLAHVQSEADEAGDLSELLALIPSRVVAGYQRVAAAHGHLMELVLDLGRPPEARFDGATVEVDAGHVTAVELADIVKGCADLGDDNRTGINRTLHRISVIRNRGGTVVGVTCRVGRAVAGSAESIRELIESGQSILLLGPPGVGKTTTLRECARILSAESGRRVVIVDTSNEIGGCGDIPHPSVGRARRMQVANTARQHGVMIEAVENHMPEVIVIDEIGTDLEAQAARTIAERGVQLIATAHGRTLDNLVANPTLNDLVGGIESVTLSDEEARRRHTQKSVLERRQRPTFDAVVEMLPHGATVVHPSTAAAVDALLRGGADARGVRAAAPPSAPLPDGTPALAVIDGSAAPRTRHRPRRRDRISVFGSGLSRQHVEVAARRAGIAVRVVNEHSDADLVVTVRRNARRPIAALDAAQQAGVPIEYARTGSVSAIADAFASAVGVSRSA